MAVDELELDELELNDHVDAAATSGIIPATNSLGACPRSTFAAGLGPPADGTTGNSQQTTNTDLKVTATVTETVTGT